MKRYRVPISGGEQAVIVLPWVACPADLEYLSAWLAAYRVAIAYPLPEESP